jgi:hypothetical protein
MPVLTYFQWSQPTAANPRLAAPISATDTIITVTSPPLDHNGAVITGNFLMGIKNDQSYTETIYVPAGAVSVDGLTLGSIGTPLVRGVRLEGLDYTTGDSTLATAFNQDSPVYCNISAVNFVMMINALQGGIGSGADVWRIGKETDDSIYVYAQNADTNKPFFRYDKTSNQWLYSNDGVNETPFGSGAGLAAGNGITIGGGAVSVNLADTNTFVDTTAGVADAGKAALLNGSGYVNQSMIDGWKDVTASAAEINQVCDGVAPTATATNLNTLTAGASSDAAALHKHSAQAMTVKNGAFSWALNSGNKVVAHSVGGTPNWVRLSGHIAGMGGGTYAVYFHGSKVGTTYACRYTGSIWGPSVIDGVITTAIGRLFYIVGYDITVTMDGTNLTFAVSSPVALTGYFEYECGL